MTPEQTSKVCVRAILLRAALEEVGPQGLKELDPSSIPFDSWLEHLDRLIGDRDEQQRRRGHVLYGKR